ncbi:unnamed protein product [Brachionus calyciflorus]|uniref:Uncharacterized protein n=1 Tax=Brachionus calyciflorus TaxID=104777 RepID=A0A813S7G4_9BILA|nr:unnamed protein product [Brachionus calyciflorus]
MNQELNFSQIDQIFNRFSLNSLQKIKANIENERTRKEIEQNDLDWEDSIPKIRSLNSKLNLPNKEFVAGQNLPKKYRFLFPKELFGKPIEEMDDFYKCDYVIFFFNLYTCRHLKTKISALGKKLKQTSTFDFFHLNFHCTEHTYIYLAFQNKVVLTKT